RRLRATGRSRSPARPKTAPRSRPAAGPRRACRQARRPSRSSSTCLPRASARTAGGTPAGRGKFPRRAGAGCRLARSAARGVEGLDVFAQFEPARLRGVVVLADLLEPPADVGQALRRQARRCKLVLEGLPLAAPLVELSLEALGLGAQRPQLL